MAYNSSSKKSSREFVSPSQTSSASSEHTRLDLKKRESEESLKSPLSAHHTTEGSSMKTNSSVYRTYVNDNSNDFMQEQEYSSIRDSQDLDDSSFNNDNERSGRTRDEDERERRKDGTHDQQPRDREGRFINEDDEQTVEKAPRRPGLERPEKGSSLERDDESRGSADKKNPSSRGSHSETDSSVRRPHQEREERESMREEEDDRPSSRDKASHNKKPEKDDSWQQTRTSINQKQDRSRTTRDEQEEDESLEKIDKNNKNNRDNSNRENRSNDRSDNSNNKGSHGSKKNGNDNRGRSY